MGECDMRDKKKVLRAYFHILKTVTFVRNMVGQKSLHCPGFNCMMLLV